MKILQYNIWNGAREEETYSALESFLSAQDYDLVAFNELKHWEAEEFKTKMKKIGYTYSELFLTESSPYFVGFASKYPLELVFSTESNPFHHSVLHVKIENINFLLTHFSPFSGIHREREAAYIAGYIQPYMHEPLVLMGDLNTLSPLDEPFYEQSGLKERFMAHEKASKNHIKDGVLNFEPMKTLLAAGLHDTIQAQGEIFHYSMPTKVHEKWKRYPFVRIDYILANAQLMKQSPTAKVLYHEELAQLSDHFPVECIIETK